MSEGTIRIIERQPARFPVLKSTGEVYRGVFTNFFGLLRAAWLPLLGYIALESWHLVQRRLAFDYRHHPEESLGGISVMADTLQHSYLFNYTSVFLSWVTLGFAAIAFHRFVLIDERKHGWKNTGVEFGAREAQFALSTVKVALLTWVPYFIANRIFMATWEHYIQVYAKWALINFVISILASGIFMRVGLALPHAALGKGSDLSFVWRRSEGHTLRLAFYSCLMVLPFGLFRILETYFAFQSGMPTTLSIYASSLQDWIFGTLLTITSLSIAYREIIGLPERDGDTKVEAA